MTKRRSIIGYQVYEMISPGRWYSDTSNLTFVTHEHNGVWWCGSSPKYTFDDMSVEVDGYLYEEEALRAAVGRYYDIVIKELEYELHRNKRIQFKIRGDA